MGTAGYSTYLIDPSETVEQKQTKLYMAICGMGDWLYQQGAAITEMNKEYLRWEKELDTFRQEIRNIRELVRRKHKHVFSKQSGCCLICDKPEFVEQDGGHK